MTVPLRSALLALLACAAPLAHAADEQEVKIGTLHGQLKYDVESFRVRPGATPALRG